MKEFQIACALLVLAACFCSVHSQNFGGISSFQERIRKGVRQVIRRNSFQRHTFPLFGRGKTHKIRIDPASIKQATKLYERLNVGEVDVRRIAETVIPSRRRITLDQRKGRKKPDISAVIGGNNGIQIEHSPQVVGGIDAVIGGVDANPIDKSRHVPWQAGIRRWNTNTRKYEAHCGGTIVSQYWILSAAHCFSPRRHVNNYKIRVGDLDNTKLEADEQEFDVLRIYLHPSFNQSDFGSYDYDLAYIRIKSNSGGGIKYNNNVERAYLPGSSIRVIPQDDCFISGWGRTTTDVTDTGSNILQVARVRVLDQAGQTLCAKNYRDMLTDRMLCAGYLDGTNIDACAGDSGGPLVCKIQDRNVLVGVTSWGTVKCAQTGYPGIYANVQNILF